MKKLMLISLFALSLCKAADPDTSWNRALENAFFGAGQEVEFRLDLSGKQIDVIPPMGLILPNLWQLDLSNNQLGAIPKMHLPELTDLDLHSNQFAAIPVGLNDLPKLSVLNLRNNQIASIPDGLRLRELTQLNLRNNQIEDVGDVNVFFRKFPNLRLLYLDGNPITQKKVDLLRKEWPGLRIIADKIGDDYSFTGWIQAVKAIPDLKGQAELNLFHKKITAIPAGLDLPELAKLILSCNQIGVIPAGLDLPKLQALWLDNNRIAAIPDKLDLPKLVWLDLNNNQITAIPAGLNLPELSELFLRNNQITAIAGLNFPKLKALALDNNQITAIPADLNLPKLFWLWLSDNQIAVIPANLNLPQLMTLDLRNNQVEHVDPQILKQFPNLRSLKLDKNPITQEEVNSLREVAVATHPNLEITAVGNPNLQDILLKDIPLPKGNPTGLPTVKINLADVETFTFTPFQELIDPNWGDGVQNFVITFTQDAEQRWHATMFDSELYNKYAATQGNIVTNPVNQQPIQYTLPITITKQGNQYNITYN